MTILLIDDDKDDQTLFCEAVREIDESIACETADDGICGLQILFSDKPLPDIIFLDINMPRLDGRETLRMIRSNSALSDIPVVIYSTSNSDTDISLFRRMGVRYCVKPNCFEQLVSLIQGELAHVLLLSDQQILR